MKLTRDDLTAAHARLNALIDEVRRLVERGVPADRGHLHAVAAAVSRAMVELIAAGQAIDGEAERP